MKADGPVLPQWAYTAAGWGAGGPVAWALHTDRRTHWDPGALLDARAEGPGPAARARPTPSNRVLRQLKTCALVYRCFTSQNIFYGRDEGGDPGLDHVQRALRGLHLGPARGRTAGLARSGWTTGPRPRRWRAVGRARTCARAGPRAMVSFGQGCEGEPLTRWRVIAEAIRRIRARDRPRARININTNASLTAGLDALFDAGLDAVRVSLNSAVADLYEAYYQPDQVRLGATSRRRSRSSRERGAYLALNLLTFPGVTDREGEVEALLRAGPAAPGGPGADPVPVHRPPPVPGGGAGPGGRGRPMGIARMLRMLRDAAPWLRVGNFARGLEERGRPAAASVER